MLFRAAFKVTAYLKSLLKEGANHLTSLPIPSINTMTKNSTAHNGDNGILAMASGYAMNAKPGPRPRERRNQSKKMCFSQKRGKERKLGHVVRGPCKMS